MAARTPRRSFATPFVITLAAAPACYVQSTPGPSGPTTTTTTSAPPTTTNPTPDQPQTQGPPTTGPGPVVVNPPMPQSQPAAPPNTKWTVFKQADGACMAAFKVECQPKATCNPPPPFKYECPQNVSLEKAITVASNADGSACFVDYGPVSCPPNTACNPPRPTPVACPKK